MVSLYHVYQLTDLKHANTVFRDSFNCLLPAYECGQFADCNTYNGKCECPPGFGGDDCLQPSSIALNTPYSLLKQTLTKE